MDMVGFVMTFAVAWAFGFEVGRHRKARTWLRRAAKRLARGRRVSRGRRTEIAKLAADARWNRRGEF
jgi:DNA-directed RNA polymerase specialized sigma24 family protein